ncbi:hypothetical protein PRIPAC_72256 [Pristionchus pacificus]|uniref:Trypsin n=1 Tax=Pristionchus pacificus TaxID=54126 RepID=A0A2A6BZH5_PRIPA|nr:hypothetical protein PRIPAC_72256 [Pristionchus pacificus]|eukprot:PDM71246.1 Trypsin [Pristionchus pacificus]
MISRLSLLLLSLLLSLAARSRLNKTTAADHGIRTIDFAQSAYDWDNCGKSTAGRARRDMGDDYIDGIDFELGETGDAAVGEMPWAVAIITKVPGHVLSAAHCLSTADELPANPGYARCKPHDHIPLQEFIHNSEVLYGGECIHRAACADESMMAKTIDIKKITMFPFFWEDCTRGNDLVIIELMNDVTTPHACLPHLHDLEDPTLMNKTGTAFHTFGWRADKSKGFAQADRLQKTSLSLLGDRCEKYREFLSKDVLCAAPGKHIGQCLGDSGAGLMTMSFGRAFIIGVLSSSGACAPVGSQATPESRFTDIRLFTANIDKELKTTGPPPDFSDLDKKKNIEL